MDGESKVALVRSASASFVLETRPRILFPHHRAGPSPHRAAVPAPCWWTSPWTTSRRTCSSTRFSKVPPVVAGAKHSIRRPRRRSWNLAQAKRPVIYVGGGVMSPDGRGRPGAARRVGGSPGSPRFAHPDGQGLPDARPPAAGRPEPDSGASPISNGESRSADLILAIGTRLAEADTPAPPGYPLHVPDSADPVDAHGASIPPKSDAFLRPSSAP